MAGLDIGRLTANAEYIDQMYEQYQRDPDSLDAQWKAFFAGFELGASGPAPTAPGKAQGADEGAGADSGQDTGKGVYGLVNGYRSMGHLVADLAPISYHRPPHPLLEMSEYGLQESDLSESLGSGGFLGPAGSSLDDLIENLRATYCGSIGVEYSGIPSKSQRDWLQKQMEPILNRPKFSRSQSHDIFARLVAAEEFEQFLHRKYIGAKRFSIEGGESLIPMLTTMAETGAAIGVEEVVLGMAHRGRLNVLAHLLQKPYEAILSEFEGAIPEQEEGEGSGDVKYHMGSSNDFVTQQGSSVHISLSPNPSHLEIVNPVIEGIVYAKQQHMGDTQCGKVVPILIHGDAAFTGQGVVTETLSLCHLNGYDTGGTIHIIVNNQIGFTALPRETRLTSYPSEMAKVIHAPVFHVNADDPEAVVHVAQMAMQFRESFKADVIIDMWCYRRYGHNEADDPVFTQPLRYAAINEHPRVTNIYADSLLSHNLITEEEVKAVREAARQKLEAALEVAKEVHPRQVMASFGGMWQGLGRAGEDWDADTALDRATLLDIARKATTAPEGFNVYAKLQRLMKTRLAMVEDGTPMDWGCAEMLSMGSLLLEGTSVRLAGQDCQRGTFSHRHGVWHDVKTGEEYLPLRHLSEGQGNFELLNSMLSELAVVGFEYGISSADPTRLTMWEGQFGDFANMAQPIIDQFISSAEAKWQRMSGLVLLLPHGYEGQGPEHSSARIERYLQLCSENNFQVCCPTTPAQYFHVLRRQMHRPFRKPLIMMMPKSLLRHKDSTSHIDELVSGEFQNVLDDPDSVDPKKVRRVVFCTGKLFFDLLTARREKEADSVAIVRIEQLYPFPRPECAAILERYRDAEEWVWAQEEPQNQGSWDFIEPKLKLLVDGPVSYIGRRPSAATATGIHRVHQREQAGIAEAVLTF